MATKKAQKTIRSFSTNFFGVVGYVASSVVWLLVLTATLLLSPSGEGVVVLTETPYEPTVVSIPGTSIEVSQPVSSPIFSFFLGILALIVFWAFAYVASRIISRVVRRVVGIFHKKLTSDSLVKIKYFIHVIGLVILVLLLVLIPGFIWMKNAIALLALLSGSIGIISIWLQHRLSKRHHVPIARVL